ncbi:MAG TPA: sugar phosphate isomerase/epimerase [Anaerolineae bacterium]|nr:sugar phosphate isomerase/epimerase [Anaerolineae bacterium]
MLSINTDYARDEGAARPYLRAIAEAGFSHIHWVHRWRGDYLYARSEMEEIGRWFREYGLQLNDLHATEGWEKFWLAPEKYRRQAGLELVQNRIDLTHHLGGDAIALHLWANPEDDPPPEFISWLREALNALLPYARERGVRIAFENLYPANYNTLRRVLAEYSPAEVGICYDSGHGNIAGGGAEFLDSVKDRLLVLHLNDNDGVSDLHQTLFYATVDWPPLAEIIAASAYDKPLSMELSIKNMDVKQEAAFLAKAMETGRRFAEMVKRSEIRD